MELPQELSEHGSEARAEIFGTQRWRLLVEEALRRVYLFEAVARQRLPEVLREELVAIALQPIRTLSDRAPVGFEAFSRFPIEPRIPPYVWFAAARSIGLETELELLALKRTRALLPWLPEECFLAIKVSPRTCAHPRLRLLLSASAADRLVIEIGARGLGNSDTEAIQMAKALGARIAVDDFAGTSAQQLQSLLHVGPAYVKVDASDGIREDPALCDLIRRLRALHLEVIACRIEEEQDLLILPRLGVRFGQGHLLDFPHLVVGSLLRRSPLLARSFVTTSDGESGAT